MTLLKLSWKNLLDKPWAMFLSLLLFSLGIGLISLLLLLDHQLQEKFEKNLAGIDLVIGAKGSPLQLILNSMYHIDAPTGNITLQQARPLLHPKHPLIEEAIPLSMGDNYRGYRILGTIPEILSWYDAGVAEGRIWAHNFEATIGAAVAQELGLQLGDRFHSSHGFTEDASLAHDDAQAFEIVGILAPTGTVIDQLILTTTQSFWLVHEHQDQEAVHEKGDSTVIEGAVNPPPSLLEASPDREITSLLIKFRGRNFQTLNLQRTINENTEMQAASPAIEINRLFTLIGSGEQVLRALAVVITVVSGISIFIALFSSLRDRRYELALMRVMGASPARLFFLLILEGLILASLGYLIGLAISHGGMLIVASVMKSSYRYTFDAWQFLPQEVLLLAGALLIGFLAALLPARQAAQTDIAETLSGG